MIQYFVVDAFSDSPFTGNPAGVCLLDAWLDDAVMQSIAAENNLAETAFVVGRGGDYGLRWFTPEVEMDLCGHATLAAAFVIANCSEPGSNPLRFNTNSGVLTVEKKDGLYEMDFPAWPARRVTAAVEIERALGARVVEAYKTRDYLFLLESESVVRELSPDLVKLAAIPYCLGVIVTAAGSEADFVSRFFAPGAGIPEDPVTGSAHSTLIPFWAERLGKREMVAKQLSRRGGTLYCRAEGNRVRISGRARLYLKGEIDIHKASV